LSPLRYEPRFYEWQALCHVAKFLSLPVLTNVRTYRPNTAVSQQREVDGIVEFNGRRMLVEVKSSPQDQDGVRTIVDKYSDLQNDELLIVAPFFAKNVERPDGVRLVEFTPNLTALRDLYQRADVTLSDSLTQELRHGDHHFRYLSACREKGGQATFRNQVDKRITSVSKAFEDIHRRPGVCSLPVRVFWSTSRWLFPKDLFYSSSSNHLVRRGLVFDIDGKAAHATSSPCRIPPGLTVCTQCLVSAKEKAIELTDFLKSQGFSDLAVVFSGRQGFHVYVLKERLEETVIRRLVDGAVAMSIPIDVNLAMDQKSVVTFPGSIHGLSMLRATEVENLQAFSIDSLSTNPAGIL
jgi:hypothetical protein